MSKTSTSKPTKTAKCGPGRPKYEPKFPRSKKWTFRDFCIANNVCLDDGDNYGKGPNCSALTLRHYIDRDMYTLDADKKPDKTKPRRNSSIVTVKNEFGKPASENGLGKPPTIYSFRANVSVNSASASKKPLAKARKSSVTVTLNTPPPVNAVSPATDAYELRKAELMGTPTPTPVASEIVPVVAITPAEIAPEPVAAPEVVATEAAAVVA